MFPTTTRYNTVLLTIFQVLDYSSGRGVKSSYARLHSLVPLSTDAFAGGKLKYSTHYSMGYSFSESVKLEVGDEVTLS